jgi:hypothetical protein
MIRCINRLEDHQMFLGIALTLAWLVRRLEAYLALSATR